jgi:hypothetical protein
MEVFRQRMRYSPYSIITANHHTFSPCCKRRDPRRIHLEYKKAALQPFYHAAG